MEATRESSCFTTRQIKDRLHDIVKKHAVLKQPLEDIKDSTDLYRAGMSSQSSVVLMIALEDHFNLEFPDAMLSRDVFTSIDTIAVALETVLRAAQ